MEAPTQGDCTGTQAEVLLPHRWEHTRIKAATVGGTTPIRDTNALNDLS